MFKFKTAHLIFAMAFFVGCQPTGCQPMKPAKKMTESQADGIVLSLMAEKLNASQTNWTVTITPRTNTPLK